MSPNQIKFSPAQATRYKNFLAKQLKRKTPLNSFQISALTEKACGVNVPPPSVRRHLAETKSGRKLGIAVADTPQQIAAKAKAAETFQRTRKRNDELIFMRSKTVRTIEAALEVAEVDTDIWEVERGEVNKWDSVAKKDADFTYKGGQITAKRQQLAVSELWQVKIWLRRKKSWTSKELRNLILADCKKIAPRYPRIRRTSHQPLLAELSIFDAHFGKLAWKPESGSNYDLSICRDRYLSAADDLLSRTAVERPERIVYVVGNDFYHTDQGRAGATNSGTPQDCDGRWQKAFRVGVQCAIETAQRAATIAPVDILCVVGNHDAEKSFCLGEVLAGRFHKCRDIKVLNDPDTYAYYSYGRTLIGFTHGDTVGSPAKRALLPNTMLTDRPRDCGKAYWREWHLGHFHSENEDVWKYRSVESIRDCVVRILPSLSGTDSWHRRNNYKSVLAAECHLYHKDHGRYAYLCHQPKDK